MARQRFIWPELWSDPTIARLPERDFLLYIACFSLADDEGRLLGDAAWLNAHAFPYRDYAQSEVKAMRNNIAKTSRSFHAYTVDGIDYIQFDNWDDFQKPKYPKPSKFPGPEQAGRKSNSRHGEVISAGERQWVRRGYIKKHVREAVLARDNNRCVRCGSDKNLQMDHILAVSKGGSNEPDNLRTLCRSCNSSKRDRDDISNNRETFLREQEQEHKSPFSGLGRAGLGRVGLDRAGLESAGEDSREDLLLEVGKILARVRDADELSETTLMAYATRLPLGAVAKVRESVEIARSPVGVGYAVNALKSEIEMRTPDAA